MNYENGCLEKCMILCSVCGERLCYSLEEGACLNKKKCKIEGHYDFLSEIYCVNCYNNRKKDK